MPKAVQNLLRFGGSWAIVWNVFGDDSRPDPFHEVTKALLNGLQPLQAAWNDRRGRRADPNGECWSQA